MSKFGLWNYIFTRYTSLLYLLSLFLFFLAIFPELLPQKIQGLIAVFVPEQITNKIQELITICAMGIGITTFVSSFINFYFQRTINRYFTIISGAERGRIRRIYKNRSSPNIGAREKDRNSALSEITEELRKSHGDICFLSIAGTDFFLGTGNILKILNQLLNADTKQTIKILLLDPRSRHAYDRAYLEEGLGKDFEFSDSTLCHHTMFAIKELERLLKNIKDRDLIDFKIQVRTYNTAPMLLYVKIDNRCFVEQYHYGISSEEMQTATTKCLGKKVPVIEYDSNSGPGQLFLAHFNYLWKTSSSREIHQGCHSKLKKAIEGSDITTKVYKATKNIEKDYISDLKDSSPSLLDSEPNA